MFKFCNKGFLCILLTVVFYLLQAVINERGRRFLAVKISNAHKNCMKRNEKKTPCREAIGKSNCDRAARAWTKSKFKKVSKQKVQNLLKDNFKNPLKKVRLWRKKLL